jgi:hypothetical protein
MDEMIIKTKRGLYGRVNVTLPLTIKTTMLDLQKRSGMKKAEFLRLALTTGFLELSKGITPSNADQTGNQAQERPLLGVSEDGRPVPLPDAGLS